MSNAVPEGVYELLASRVNTFEKLELIVALHAEPRATSTIDGLSRILKLPRDVLRQAVMELRASSLIDLTSRGEVQLLPPSEKDRASVAELARIYGEDRMLLVRTLGEISMNRVRSMAAKVFADAFVIRKKREDGDG